MSTSRSTAIYGRYHLLELVARGGMAEVFKAKARGVEGFEKVVVIKRILPELAANRRFVEMFVQEAKLAVHLSHANIVQVFDLGRAEGTYFIAMEYVAGYDLARVLRRARRHGRAMGPELAAHVAAEVAKGLDHAHRRRDASGRPMGIVHRDVSPHNVLLSFEGEVKLTDFGIAKARTIVEDPGGSGVLKGKYAYMAPEQARGEEVDARADLFALGVVLYEMLAGRNPLLADSDYETLRRVREGRFEPLRLVVPDLPEELLRVVERAMAPDREGRYPTAADLHEDLVRYLFGTGRRVGARAVASFLDELRSVSEQRRSARREAALRRAFEPASREQPEPAEEVTPVEVPSSARSRTGSSPRDRRRERSASRPGVGLERRDVSVLLLSGPAGGAWPQGALRELVGAYGGVSSDIRVERSEEGEVRQWTALFGLRWPDGRDAERAVACGLRMLARLRRHDPSLASLVRMVVHEGSVVADRQGELVPDERYERLLAQGRVALGMAPAGVLFVTPGIERLVSARFDLEPDPDDPAAGSRVLGERDVVRALDPLVGRVAELRRLGEAVVAAREDGPRLVLLEGETGIGKTRLLAEVAARVTGRRHAAGVTWVDLAGVGGGVPLGGVREVLRSLLGISEETERQAARQRVERLREAGLTDADVAGVEALLGLRASEETSVVGNRLAAALLARSLAGVARDGLHLLLVDGAEHLDEHSAEALGGALAEMPQAPLLVVLATRPGSGVGTALARVGSGHVESLALGPLSRDDLEQLVARRLGAAQVPGELMRDVEAFASGNPRLVVEYVQALDATRALRVDGGRVRYTPTGAQAALPRTLRGVVEARVGSLSPEARYLLRICAFAGDRVTAELLADVADVSVDLAQAALEQFEGLGFLERRTSREYGVAHDLLGRVLREAVPREEGARIHGAIADALRGAQREAGPDLAERIGRHLRFAGRLEEAVEQLEQAASALAAGNAYEAAVHVLERALRWLGEQHPERRLDLCGRLVEACVRARAVELGRAAVEQAVELAERLGRAEEVARFAMLGGRLLLSTNRVTEARRWLARAEQIARAEGASETLREVRMAMAEAFTRAGEWGLAVGPLQEAVALARAAGDMGAEFRGQMALAQSLAGSGRPEEARLALAECRRLAERLGEPLARCEYHKNAGLVRLLLGDAAGLLEEGQRALDLAREHGFVYEEAVNLHNLGEVRLQRGDERAAFPLLRRSYELCEQRGYERLRHLNLRVLGFLDAWRFGSPAGRKLVEDALRYAEREGYTWDAIQARYTLALLALAGGRPEEATERFAEVLRDSERYGNRHYAAEAEQALSALRSGRTPRVEELLGHGPRSSVPPGMPASEPPGA